MTILAVGAAGEFAGIVIPALVERGAHVRGMIRKAEQSEIARKNGAAEVAVADLHDRSGLLTALRGTESIFYIAPAFLPDEAEVGKGVVEAAIDAGVRRFVFSGVIHPVLTNLVNHQAKIAVENAILDSDLEYTFLHPSFYFQNYKRVWPDLLKRGVLAEPWSPDTAFPAWTTGMLRR